MSGPGKIAWLTVAALLLYAAPGLAQHAGARAVRQPRVDSKQPKNPTRDEEKKEARQAERVVQKHAGDWLRRYKDLPPDQQRQALEKDPDFQKLPPHRQAQLLQRLQHFSGLPAKQQERVLSRMETFEHLTPDQKRQRNQLNQEIRQLPPQRRQVLIKAIRGMRDMTPEQREQVIGSDEFKSAFSDHERDLLNGAARLPLAPGDAGGQSETPNQ